jgi:hypothetical protein
VKDAQMQSDIAGNEFKNKKARLQQPFCFENADRW